MHPSTTWPHEGFATRNNRSLPALMRLASRESENLPPSGFRPRIGRLSCRTLRACGVPASCAWRTRGVSRTVHGHTARGTINATSAAPPPHAPRTHAHAPNAPALCALPLRSVHHVIGGVFPGGKLEDAEAPLPQRLAFPCRGIANGKRPVRTCVHAVGKLAGRAASWDGRWG